MPIDVKVVALLTCHDRKDLTLRCLDSFFSQSCSGTDPELAAILVDDGSSDGTRGAVEASFSGARVVTGDGTLFWAGGMQLAELHAREEQADFFLWLNDDVELDAGALDRLLATAGECPGAVIVGALRDPATGALTYSGVVRSSWHPLRTRLVVPGEGPVDADTFNGNVVLIDRAVSGRVGPIDGRFSHGQADFDYGLRARRADCRVVVAPGTVGTCPRNAQRGTFLDSTLPLADRWRLIQSPKGLPMQSHARYLRRHGGVLWPIFWATPYVKLTMGSLIASVRRRSSGSGR